MRTWPWTAQIIVFLFLAPILFQTGYNGNSTIEDLDEVIPKYSQTINNGAYETTLVNIYTSNSVDLSGDYIEIHAADGTGHVFWFDTSGGDAPPQSSHSMHKIGAFSLTNNSEFAQALFESINAIPSFEATVFGFSVNIINTQKGNVEDANTNALGNEVLVLVSKQGENQRVDAGIDWSKSLSGSTMDIQSMKSIGDNGSVLIGMAKGFDIDNCNDQSDLRYSTIFFFDSDGVCQWFRKTGTVNQTSWNNMFSDLEIGNDGIFVKGSTEGDIQIAGDSITGHRTFIAKISFTGIWQWAVELPDNYMEHHGGGITMGADNDGGLVISRNFEGQSVQFGSVTISSPGGISTFIAKINSQGNFDWGSRIGDGGNVPYSLQIPDNNEIIWYGSSGTFGPLKLIKYSSIGDYVSESEIVIEGFDNYNSINIVVVKSNNNSTLLGLIGWFSATENTPEIGFSLILNLNNSNLDISISQILYIGEGQRKSIPLLVDGDHCGLGYLSGGGTTETFFANIECFSNGFTNWSTNLPMTQNEYYFADSYEETIYTYSGLQKTLTKMVAPSKVDADEDFVMDVFDQCLGTMDVADVNENGCSWQESDVDGDGVLNPDDNCHGLIGACSIGTQYVILDSSYEAHESWYHSDGSLMILKDTDESQTTSYQVINSAGDVKNLTGDPSNAGNMQLFGYSSNSKYIYSAIDTGSRNYPKCTITLFEIVGDDFSQPVTLARVNGNCVWIGMSPIKQSLYVVVSDGEIIEYTSDEIDLAISEQWTNSFGGEVGTVLHSGIAVDASSKFMSPEGRTLIIQESGTNTWTLDTKSNTLTTASFNINCGGRSGFLSESYFFDCDQMFELDTGTRLEIGKTWSENNLLSALPWGIRYQDDKIDHSIQKIINPANESLEVTILGCQDADCELDGLSSLHVSPNGEEMIISEGGGTYWYAYLDSDLDEVPDILDICQDTASQSSTNSDGCAPDQVDSDGDGINDSQDLCPDTVSGVQVDQNGCASNQIDSDGDGISDATDQCPNTPGGDSVGLTGCSSSQTDSDEDGINDSQDICPGTSSGMAVDNSGCAANQLDSDGDGINDSQDICPGTSSGMAVDNSGCAANQRDSDGDGISDATDECPNTPNGQSVGLAGCSSSQIDSDGDGITDSNDDCPNSLFDSTVDASGCAQNDVVDLDSDEDGVRDSADTCPNTSLGVVVDSTGCETSGDVQVANEKVQSEDFEDFEEFLYGCCGIIFLLVILAGVISVIKSVIEGRDTGQMDWDYGRSYDEVGDDYTEHSYENLSQNISVQNPESNLELQKIMAELERQRQHSEQEINRLRQQQLAQQSNATEMAVIQKEMLALQLKVAESEQAKLQLQRDVENAQSQQDTSIRIQDSAVSGDIVSSGGQKVENLTNVVGTDPETIAKIIFEAQEKVRNPRRGPPPKSNFKPPKSSLQFVETWDELPPGEWLDNDKDGIHWYLTDDGVHWRSTDGGYEVYNE